MNSKKKLNIYKVEEYSWPNNVKFTVWHPIKNIRHGKKQENTVPNEQVNQLIKIYEQLNQILESDEIKMVIITAFHMFGKLVETWKI